MKRNISKSTRLALAALALFGLGRLATADIVSNAVSTTLTAWPSAGANGIFYSSQPLASASLSGTAGPTAATGALANSLSETFTITNGAGTLGGYAGPGSGTNYVLTGVAILVSGYSTTVPCTLHIYDVTSNLTATSGTTLNGAATYTLTSPTPQGDLLGENQGLPFINAAASGAEHILYLALQNGPNTYGDQVILASNHTYALEVSVPTANAVSGVGNFFWFKSATADPGGEGMGSVNAGNPATPRQTTAALGLTGGPPRDFAMALYGYAATNNQIASVNPSTNVVITTNYWIDQFNALSVSPGNQYYTNAAFPDGVDYSTNAAGTSEISAVWNNWFGIAPNITWDNTNDAQGNTNGGLGGSMLIQPVFAIGSQLEMWDSASGIAPPLNGTLLGLTSFECDVMFDSSSAVQTNYTTGLVYFGNLQFGLREANFSQDYFPGVFTIPQSMSNQWVHVKSTISPAADPALNNILDILVHIYGPFGNGGTNQDDLIGPVKMWVDNVKFKGPLAPPLTPPPAVKIAKASAGSARFFGVSPQYTRTELATFDNSPTGGAYQSWIGSVGDDGTGGPFSVPVKYTISLSHMANAANVATRIWLVDNDVNSTYNGNDYSVASELWLDIDGIGANGWRATVAYKAFLPGNNPNNTALVVTNALGAGTWTLTFTGWTNGTLMAPGWTTASNFFLNVTSVSNTTTGDTGLTAFVEAFSNPLTALFGIEDDNGTAVGAYDDFTLISVTNVIGVNEYDNFALDTAVDLTNMWTGKFNTGAPTGYYQITNAAAMGGAGFTSAYPATLQTPIILVTTNTPYWVSWNVTTNGYGLGESTNGLLPISSLVSPQALSGYTDAPAQITAGGTNWVLIPSDCLPTTNQSYFRVVNPPPQF